MQHGRAIIRALMGEMSQIFSARDLSKGIVQGGYMERGSKGRLTRGE
jgi:hypothetical protein